MMKTSLVHSLQYLINKTLQLDPDSKTRLKKLEGQVATITLLPFYFSFQCQFTAHELLLTAEETTPAHIHIKGTPLNLLNVTISQNRKFLVDEVTLQGDAAIAQQMVDLFNELHIDWENILSHYIGDIPTHHLGKWSRLIKNELLETSQVISNNISEYLHEELRLFPGQEELSDFLNDIDKLNMDADRLFAKYTYLEKLIKESESS